MREGMMADDTGFTGSIPETYDRCLGAAMFGPHAEVVARRLSDLRGGALCWRWRRAPASPPRPWSPG
ncbi:hypothetical protein [Dankookia sp. P2]|uniref:hypothetical protein n=1 Tax=Dankookia sp. P2 TaxID=3423955 RepID=UPI003D6645CC